MFILQWAFLLALSCSAAADSIQPRIKTQKRWGRINWENLAERGMGGFGAGRGSFSGSGWSGNGWTGGGHLSPWQQSGRSKWGTLNQTSLPKYDGRSHPGWGGIPWGKITTENANPYISAPRGTTKKYHLTISLCDIRPDGVVTKEAICVNDQYPGPLIEANYGDFLEITVTNALEHEGTAMHWHGFLQTNNNQNDGVPGVHQCPIAPGQSFTYKMKAELYGSSWYHTHYSSQYAGGASGPLVIYGPWNSGYDIDVGPVMLAEWYRNEYFTYVEGLMRPLSQGGPIHPKANSNLINGKMKFPCEKTSLPCVDAEYSKFNFTTGKNHRLRLMNTGASAVQKFSIDGHTMQVIALDYMPVKPYNTSMVALGVGQRADVIVFGAGKKGSKYWMRSNIVSCSLNDGQLTEARAVIYYQRADTKTLPSAPANQGPAAGTSPMLCANDPLAKTVPTYPLPARKPDAIRQFDTTVKSNGTHILYYMGNQSFRADFNKPLLPHALNYSLANLPPRRNFWNLNKATVARAIIYNYDTHAPHPMHLHGHNMQILSVGMGKWDGTIVRASNPMVRRAQKFFIGNADMPLQRRDVQMMPPALNEATPSHLVIQWDTDNPGSKSSMSCSKEVSLTTA